METISITIYEKRKRWKFPDDQFVTYDKSDESWCRFFGIGEEVEDIVTINIPHAIITNVDEDGTITFRLLTKEKLYDYY